MKSMFYGFPNGFSGRIGNAVAYNWCGRMCVRSLPSHYNDARTPQQVAQRSVFKYVVNFASKGKKALRLGLRAVSREAQMTESNYFMRINKNCFASVAADGTDGDGTTMQVATDYQNLVLADGPVAPVAFGEPQWIDEVTLQVGFDKNPLHRVTKSEDLVYLVAYCPELGDFDISTPAYRRSNKVTISLNTYWAGREVHLWGFVVDGAGRASLSQYICLSAGNLPADTSSDIGTLPANTYSVSGRMPAVQNDAIYSDLQPDTVPADAARTFQRHQTRCSPPFPA